MCLSTDIISQELVCPPLILLMLHPKDKKNLCPAINQFLMNIFFLPKSDKLPASFLVGDRNLSDWRCGEDSIKRKKLNGVCSSNLILFFIIICYLATLLASFVSPCPGIAQCLNQTRLPQLSRINRKSFHSYTEINCSLLNW